MELEDDDLIDVDFNESISRSTANKNNVATRFKKIKDIIDKFSGKTFN